jgi:hypothetical protein
VELHADATFIILLCLTPSRGQCGHSVGKIHITLFVYFHHNKREAFSLFLSMSAKLKMLSMTDSMEDNRLICVYKWQLIGLADVLLIKNF